MIANGKEVHCYGCGVCVAACPYNAIRMILSAEGFWVPEVDDKLCVQCGICNKVCAYEDDNCLTPFDRKGSAGAYAVVHKDASVQRTSTSGGAGFAIATYLHQIGYLLVGVEYDSQSHIARHFVAENLEDFKRTMNSKYIQSYTVEGFSDLLDGRKYVVFGTPCQIDSLRRWIRMKKKEDNFVFIDLFCHGVPSYFLWSAYLKFRLKKDEQLVNPVFRDKRNGWHTYTMSLLTNKRNMSFTLQHNDYFQNMFLGNFVLNKSCYTCKYRGDKSAADLRLGDLWGEKYAKIETGVTGVLALTEKGMEIIKSISDNLCNVTEEKASTIQAGQLHHNLHIPKVRKLLLDSFRNGAYLPLLYFKYAYKMWMKNLLPDTIKCFIKNLFYRNR